MRTYPIFNVPISITRFIRTALTGDFTSGNYFINKFSNIERYSIDINLVDYCK